MSFPAASSPLTQDRVPNCPSAAAEWAILVNTFANGALCRSIIHCKPGTPNFAFSGAFHGTCPAGFLYRSAIT